jgi:hypothetical protein
MARRETAAEFWRRLQKEANELRIAQGKPPLEDRTNYAAIPGYKVGSPFRETASAAWGEAPKRATGVWGDNPANEFRPTDTIKPPPGIWNDKPASPWANVPPVRVGNKSSGDKPSNHGESRSPWR